MSKVTLALGSFIVGACCMFLALSGNHASTFAQGKISAPGSVSAIDIPGAIPVVPNLTMGFTDEEIGGLMQQIDGLICTRCTFTSPVLTYGGGPFSLVDSKMAVNTRIMFTGAAANTVVLLSILQGANIVKPPHQSKPNAPIERLANVTQPITFSLNSPYGLK